MHTSFWDFKKNLQNRFLDFSHCGSLRTKHSSLETADIIVFPHFIGNKQKPRELKWFALYVTLERELPSEGCQPCALPVNMASRGTPSQVGEMGDLSGCKIPPFWRRAWVETKETQTTRGRADTDIQTRKWWWEQKGCDFNLKNSSMVGTSRDLAKQPVALQMLTSVMDQKRRSAQNRVRLQRAEPKESFDRKLPTSETQNDIGCVLL